MPSPIVYLPTPCDDIVTEFRRFVTISSRAGGAETAVVVVND